MTYETYIFRPNAKKKRDDLLYLMYIVLAGVVVFIFYLMHIPTIGMFGGVSLAFTLFKMKIEDDKKKGVRRLGHLIDKLVISDDSITFGNLMVPDKDLRNVLIYAGDYEGRGSDFFGLSYGTDNRIEFEFKGNKYSFQFQVRKKADLKLINDIALVIEDKTLTGNLSKI
jgi:hypothetical protein